MKNKICIVKTIKLFMLGIVLIGMANTSALATQNTLSAIEIKNSENGYQILLSADRATEIRKTTESTDDIVLQLKGVTPIESVATVYNNVPEIENVIIEQVDKDSTKITIHGTGVASSNVNFSSLPLITGQSTNNEQISNSSSEIELSQPMESYAPVTKRANLLEENDDSSAYLNEIAGTSLGIFKKIAIKAINYLSQIDKKILALGSIFMIIILVGLKALKTDKKDEIKIGLSQSLKDKEMEMKDELNLSNELQTIRNQRPQSANPSSNYGLKAYQNSQRNPYTSQITGLNAKPQAQMQKRPAMQKSAYDQNQAVLQAKLKQAQAQNQAKKLASAPSSLAAKAPQAISRPVAQQPQAISRPSVQPQVVDSMKFLESMTKIYERSGRTDLANGLKSNMQKVQTAKI